MNNYFVGHDGSSMNNDIPCPFSTLCDVVITRGKIHKLKEDINVVYSKTEFLDHVIDHLLPLVESPIQLITGSSDFSPQVNLKEKYSAIVDHPMINRWYMENKAEDHPKVKSFPVGLSKYNFEIENYVRELSERREDKKTERIFASWRKRTHNDCGNEFCFRPTFDKMMSGISTVDWFDPNFSLFEFYDKLSTYRYCLNIHGNGLDPSPTLWVCLAFGVTPIVMKTVNTLDLLHEVRDSIIFIDKPEDIMDIKLEDKPLCSMEFLTSEYWIKKVREDR